jgi:hypothetical protein
MIHRKMILTVSILISFVIINICFSAEIKTEKGGSNLYSIYIKGEIKRGDFDKFNSALQEIKSQNGIGLVVVLISIGGDAIEAMKIGELVRTNYLITQAPERTLKVNLSAPVRERTGLIEVPWCVYRGPFTDSMNDLDDKDCNCASACFLIWSAGVLRQGATIGIHRPTFSKEYFSGLSVDQGEKTYNQFSEYVKAYCKKMNIPQNIIDKMFEISSREIIYLDRNTIKTLKKAPFFDEWVTAKCETYTEEDHELHLQLFRKKEPLGRWSFELSPEELKTFEQLDKKNKAYNKCVQQIIFDAQKESGIKN